MAGFHRKSRKMKTAGISDSTIIYKATMQTERVYPQCVSLPSAIY